MSFPCPLCGAVARIRTSRMLSVTTKETYYNCSNHDCCHQFKTLEGDPKTLAGPVSPAQTIPADKLRHMANRDRMPLPALEKESGKTTHRLR